VYGRGIGKGKKERKKERKKEKKNEEKRRGNLFSGGICYSSSFFFRLSHAFKRL